jgi:hypothetical protein
LKALAFNHIRSQLTKCDIVGETFSRFASRWARHIVGADFALTRGIDTTRSEIYTLNNSRLPGRKTRRRRQSLPVSTKSLTAMAKRVSSTRQKLSSCCWRSQIRTIKSNPLRIPHRKYDHPSFSSFLEVLISCQQVIRPASPAHWAFVKAALIKSIRRGVFFDREYWARHSNAGDLSKPVYFSSTIMNDKALQLGKCVSNLTFWHGDVLSVPSGEILQGYKPSHGRSLGGYDCRKRLRRRVTRNRERATQGRAHSCIPHDGVILSVRPLPYHVTVPREVTGYPAGNLFSSTGARIESRSLPSIRRAQSLAWITFAKTR